MSIQNCTVGVINPQFIDCPQPNAKVNINIEDTHISTIHNVRQFRSHSRRHSSSVFQNSLSRTISVQRIENISGTRLKRKFSFPFFYIALHFFSLCLSIFPLFLKFILCKKGLMKMTCHLLVNGGVI